MRIKNKLFPYPTIQENNGVYKTSVFASEVTLLLDDKSCKLLFGASTNNSAIQSLIDAGDASYAFHLECTYTYFRKVIMFNGNQYSIALEGDSIDRKMEVCPMIVAVKDINRFSSSDLNDIYEDEDISFSKGDILAIGEQRVLTIIKNKDALKKLSSIFYVQAYPDGFDYKHMSFKFEDRQIGILLPANDAARFSQCKDDPKRKNTLFSAFFFPALIGVIDVMMSKDGEQYEDNLWYAVLEAKGKEKGLGDIEDWKQRTSFEIAQVLFDYPVTRYLKELATASEEEDMA